MTKLLKKLTSYRNWIGRTILFLLGIAIGIGLTYSIVLVGLFLTDRELPFSVGTYIIFYSLSVAFILSGVYLNRFLDKVMSRTVGGELPDDDPDG